MIIWYLIDHDEQEALEDYQRRKYRRKLRIPDKPVENIESVEEIAVLMAEKYHEVRA
jgi:hypothetical protein